MIAGVVTPNREAVVSITLQGPDGREQAIDAVIDTGFNGFLTLPTALVSALSLPRHGSRRAILGDGSAVFLDVYQATVVWNDQAREVLALAAEGGPLIGMSMLYGCAVLLHVVDGGPMTIQPLPGDSSMPGLPPL